jgi:hypothetical protein
VAVTGKPLEIFHLETSRSFQFFFKGIIFVSFYMNLLEEDG